VQFVQGGACHFFKGGAHRRALANLSTLIRETLVGRPHGHERPWRPRSLRFVKRSALQAALVSWFVQVFMSLSARQYCIIPSDLIGVGTLVPVKHLTENEPID
jgi:hypothetical protein